MADEPQEMGEITAHAGALALNMGTPGERREPVSYTHLDVYKRQLFADFGKWIKFYKIKW